MFSYDISIDISFGISSGISLGLPLGFPLRLPLRLPLYHYLIITPRSILLKDSISSLSIPFLIIAYSNSTIVQYPGYPGFWVQMLCLPIVNPLGQNITKSIWRVANYRVTGRKRVFFLFVLVMIKKLFLLINNSLIKDNVCPSCHTPKSRKLMLFN